MTHYDVIIDEKSLFPVNQLAIFRDTSFCRNYQTDICYQRDKSFRISYHSTKSVSIDFRRIWPEIGFLWRFWTENSKVSVLPEFFSSFHGHISLCFGVGENDAGVRLSLSHSSQKLAKKWVPKKEKYIADYDSKKTYLGNEQWSWLKKIIKEKADIKILISSIQVLAEGHGFEKWGNLPLEKKRLYDLVDENNIKKLIILSGDRHRAGIYKDKTENGNELFELTSSSLNLAAGKIFKAKEEAGPNRIGPTYLMENYGTLEINSNKNVLLSIKDLNQQTQNKINVNLS